LRSINSQSIGRFLTTRSSRGQVAGPSSGLYSRIEPMFFNLGSSLNPSNSVNANPTTEAPCVSV
jgi:hypothetical protein